MSTRAVPTAVLTIVLAAGLTCPVVGSHSTQTESQADRRPNIILVTTDDMATYDLRWMPKTRRLLGEHGRRFPRALSPHPLCCPARAELLTGQYAQNNGVQHNTGRYGGFKRLHPGSTIATWLDAAGYQTAFHGKYLNGFTVDDRRQQGWDEWSPLVRGVYEYTHFALRGGSGRIQSYPDSYVTDVLRKRTNRSVRRFAAVDDPFFIWTSHVAPHGSQGPGGVGRPPIPAARHRGIFRTVKPPSMSRPNYNEARIGDQPGAIRVRDKVKANDIRRLFRQRIRSLRAVDQAVASLVRTLRRAGELDSTWIFFTSDNGFAQGEHRYVGKNFLQREITGVPLLVRGPGVATGTRSALRVTLTDLPVTFAAIAEVEPTLVVDGQSFLDDLLGRLQPWRDTQLIQTGTGQRKATHHGWAFRGVLAGTYSYGRDMRNGDRFLYDHVRDPYELHNLAGRPAYAAVVAELERRAAVLRSCAGSSCRLSFGPVSATGSSSPRAR